jgi:putative oxidoreductase
VETVDAAAFNTATLALRLGLGAMLISHGINKVFGEGGMAGTTDWFASLGLRPAWLHARVAAATEIAASILMLLGLFTPLAAAAFVGLMGVAAFTDHRGKGFFVFRGGWEYVAFVALAALVIAALGPGRWSFDAPLGWFLEGGLRWAALALALGASAAFGLVVASRERSGIAEK